MDFSKYTVAPWGQSEIQQVEEATVHIDPSGDIKLLAQTGENKKTFVVSSKAMCLASPVWSAMLNPKSHFKEANPNNNAISLKDDDQEALSILLDIAHLRFSKIPLTVTYELLIGLAVLCDKYDLVTLVQPWLPKWYEKLWHLRNGDGFERWLFIAWTFGDATTFECNAVRLVLEITPGVFGHRIATRLLPRENMPPGIVG